MLAVTSKISLKLITAVYAVFILSGCTAALASDQAGLKGLQTRLTEIQNCFPYFPSLQAATNDSHLLQSALTRSELSKYCQYVTAKVTFLNNSVVNFTQLDDLLLPLYQSSEATFGRKLKEDDVYYNNYQDYLCYLGHDGDCYLTSQPAKTLNYPCKQKRVASQCVCGHDTVSCTKFCDRKRNAMDSLGCNSYDITNSCNIKYGANIGFGYLPDCLYDNQCTTSQCTSSACASAGVSC